MTHRAKLFICGGAAIGWGFLLMGVTYVIDGVQPPSGSVFSIKEDGGATALAVETDGDIACTIANQKVGIGATPDSLSQLYLTTASSTPRGIYLDNTASSQAAQRIVFRKSRSGGAVQNTDFVMFFGASAHDGTTMQETVAGYTVEVGGSVSAGNVPLDAVIRTGSVGHSLGGSERIRFFASGGKARFGSDAGLFMNWSTGDNTIGFGTDGANVFSVDTDAPAAGLTYTGGADIDKELTVGSSGSPRTIYQPASEGRNVGLLIGVGPAYQSGDYWTDNGITTEWNIAFDCPNQMPGTVIASIKVMLYAGDGDESFNVTMSKSTTTSPGTVTNFVGPAGTDFTTGSGLNNIATTYYYRLENSGTDADLPYPIASNEKVWVTVELEDPDGASQSRCLGIEWTFNEMKY
ncbi:MAG: hypothetical protein GHCLOJNM_03062 [bacterium]|nr:hypothetical protein [bacterium]